MTPEAADIVALVALIIAGPFGLVLIVALVRGYSLTVRLRRPRKPPRELDERRRERDEDPHPP